MVPGCRRRRLQRPTPRRGASHSRVAPKAVARNNLKSLSCLTRMSTRLSACLSAIITVRFAHRVRERLQQTGLRPDDGITKDALGDGEFTAYRSIRSRHPEMTASSGCFRRTFATFETFRHKPAKSFTSVRDTGPLQFRHDRSKKITPLLENPGPRSFNGDRVTFGRPAVSPTRTNPLGWRWTPGTRQDNRHSRGINVRMGQRSGPLPRPPSIRSAPGYRLRTSRLLRHLQAFSHRTRSNP